MCVCVCWGWAHHHYLQIPLLKVAKKGWEISGPPHYLWPYAKWRATWEERAQGSVIPCLDLDKYGQYRGLGGGSGNGDGGVPSEGQSRDQTEGREAAVSTENSLSLTGSRLLGQGVKPGLLFPGRKGWRVRGGEQAGGCVAAIHVVGCRNVHSGVVELACLLDSSPTPRKRGQMSPYSVLNT